MSSIKEHLENMEFQIHRMNQDGHVTEPDEFVVATGETRSVRDLCDIVFMKLGLDYQDYVL